MRAVRRRRHEQFAVHELVTRRMKRIVDAATALQDLNSPPGNRLQKLMGNRSGQWSIRVNDQWRDCFQWNGTDAHAVELVDYHQE